MHRAALYLAVAIGLTGCEDFRNLPTPPPAPPSVETPAVSEASRAVARHYAGVQARLLAQGRLRTDTAPEDAPWTNQDLERNFVSIALFDEYTNRGGLLVEATTASHLRRWADPVRIRLLFGETVSPAIRETDRLAMQGLVRQLRAATGHPI